MATMTTDISQLESFPDLSGMPRTDDEVATVLRSQAITAITWFVLGPAGTNISQAAMRMSERLGVKGKSRFVYCDAPEASLAQAASVDQDGHIALFGTCAVYYALNKLFFEHPASLPFFGIEVMNLDEMQLAAREPGLVALFKGGVVEANWRIASHPSPAPLVRGLPCEVVRVNSNAAAAKLCANGGVELCITTEDARQRHDLTKIHSFGSPPMVFFYGLAGPSIARVRALV